MDIELLSIILGGIFITVVPILVLVRHFINESNKLKRLGFNKGQIVKIDEDGKMGVICKSKGSAILIKVSGGYYQIRFEWFDAKIIKTLNDI